MYTPANEMFLMARAIFDRLFDVMHVSVELIISSRHYVIISNDKNTKAYFIKWMSV